MSSPCTRPPWPRANTTVIRRNLGSKLIKMVFADRGSRQVHPHRRCRRADRNVYSLTDEDVLELGRYAMIIEKHTTVVRWTSSGARAETTAKLYIRRPVRETVKSQQSGHVMEVPPQTVQRSPDPRPCHPGRRPVPARSASSRMRPRWTASRPATFWSPNATDPNWEPVMRARVPPSS